MYHSSYTATVRGWIIYAFMLVLMVISSMLPLLFE